VIVDPDTLHCDAPNPLLWSRANFEEAMPGVLTPLSWSFWGVASEASSRRIYTQKMGALGRDELTGSLADSTAVLFWGRAAVNVDLLRRVLDRLPGVDPDALELQILGNVRPDAVSNPTLRRVPHVLGKAPLNVALVPRRIRAMRASVDAWWRYSTATEPTSLAAAGRLLVDARQRFTDVCTEHGFNVFVGQGGYDRLAQLAVVAGHPGLELALSASGAGTEETRMIGDLWAAAQGRQPVDEIVARHGYHGPAEGELSSHSWREDRGPLLAMLESFRAAGSPRTSSAARDRAGAEALLFAGLSRAKRLQARAMLRFVDTYIPLREVGKVAFLQCIDAGRHAAHAAGRLLAAAGSIDDPDDIRFVTVEEIVAGDADRHRVAHRRARREELLALDLPDTWIGVPDAWLRADAPVDDDPIVRGVGASPGRHKGVARLVATPDDYTRLEAGDVLVCELTDPGWTPLFAIAGAAVIDIGGPLSHGAIVARELGIPCVIGTGDGTLRIGDGAVVEVDGDRGEVVPC
jgi:phosphohistidine swiveling domain-containing protein